VAVPDLEWLKTREGRRWLETDEGIAWQRTDEGRRWMDSAEGRSWFDELAQRGFARYFSGDLPEPPDWAITPGTAPPIGSRVRLTERGAGATLGGTAFAEGELRSSTSCGSHRSAW
jgi:hypothetical protein